MTPVEHMAISATVGMCRPDSEEDYRSDQSREGEETKEVGPRSYVTALMSSLLLMCGSIAS
jgi:hypothetical protein